MLLSKSAMIKKKCRDKNVTFLPSLFSQRLNCLDFQRIFTFFTYYEATGKSLGLFCGQVFLECFHWCYSVPYFPLRFTWDLTLIIVSCSFSCAIVFLSFLKEWFRQVFLTSQGSLFRIFCVLLTKNDSSPSEIAWLCSLSQFYLCFDFPSPMLSLSYAVLILFPIISF